MKFSESEIQPLWDEVARIIGDGVIQMRHRGEPLSADALIGYLDEQLVTATGVQRRILLGAAINLLKADRRS
ncbi:MULTISPECIES: hypothetical protein [Rahnella]|jgi:hypothetical protein|uniref:Fumarate hydratase n=1 Tax=Rahnella variigena TaxID=574964 RepID=A0ABX9PW49_9GAMM|nr:MULTISPECIES: hypothetical protein [Rahnella]MDH2897362.1 hypothetical protein [Rahnella variigena]RJT56524.1 hypothetical protein D6D38_01925 [Rahnella variigena]RKF68864.1 hypothetical protein CKQ54_11045 [Rahnella variigena]RYJ17548.1 hypothetical protein C5Y41_10040 [Rahnella variigena]TCQ93167.1 hypothetical protein EC840_101210 [Rahnella sp. JUb53]